MKLKRLALLLLSVCLLAQCAACGKGVSETELVVLYNAWHNPGIGYMTTVLPNIKLLLETSKKDDLQLKASYTATKYGVDAAAELGYTVRLDDWGWGDSLRQKVVGAYLSGRGPDVLIGESNMVSLAEEGSLRPFPDDLAAWIRGSCAPAGYKLMEFNGNVYGVAPQPTVFMLSMNKAWTDTIFGTDYAGPKTWAEWLADMDTVKDFAANKPETSITVNGSSISSRELIPGGIYMAPEDDGYYRTSPFFLQNHGSLTGENGMPSFDTEANRETLRFFREMEAKNPKAIMNSTTDAFNNRYNGAKAVYAVEGCWVRNNNKQFGFDTLLCELPLPPGGVESNLVIGATIMGVPTYTSDAKANAAFAYIKAYMSDAAQTPAMDVGLKIPVNKNLVTDEWLNKNPYFKPFWRYMQMENLDTVPRFKYENAKSWGYVGDALKYATSTNSAGNYLRSIEWAAQNTQSSLMTIYNNNI